MNKKIIYFPGFLSQPNSLSPKIKLFEELGYDISIADTHGQYSVHSYSMAVFDEVHKLLLDPISDTVFVGTSLGGFWSRIMGYLTVSPWIALNPSVFPSKDLEKWIGEQSIYGSDQKFTLTQEHLDQYKKLENTVSMVSRTPGLIIAAEDDDVIIPGDIDLIQSVQIELLPTGGHRLENIEDYKDIIKTFLEHAL